jgi:hypothetical protein
MLRKINKRGLSEMVGYVLLIGIAISLSILVFIWMSRQVPSPAEYCPEDISLYIENYRCGNGEINLSLKNMGLFNVSGFIIRGSYDPDIEPLYGLAYSGPLTELGVPISPGIGGLPSELSQGIVYLSLEPGETYPDEVNEILEFKINNLNLYKILIEPFDINLETNERVLCDNAIIIQEVDDTVCVGV